MTVVVVFQCIPTLQTLVVVVVMLKRWYLSHSALLSIFLSGSERRRFQLRPWYVPAIRVWAWGSSSLASRKKNKPGSRTILIRLIRLASLRRPNLSYLTFPISLPDG